MSAPRNTDAPGVDPARALNLPVGNFQGGVGDAFGPPRETHYLVLYGGATGLDGFQLDNGAGGQAGRMSHPTDVEPFAAGRFRGRFLKAADAGTRNGGGAGRRQGAMDVEDFGR